MNRLRRTAWALAKQPPVLLGLALIPLGASYLEKRAGTSGPVVFLAPAAAVLLLLGAFRSEVTSHALRSARAALDEEHQNLDRIVNHAPIGIIVIDRDGRFITVNPAFCRMLRYSMEELTGRRFIEFVHPEDRDAALRKFNVDFGRTESGAQYERRYVARDGSVVWSLVTLSPATDGLPHQAVRVAQILDITKRKRAEAALAEERQLLMAFLTTTPDQVYFKDLESRFIRVSVAQASRLGFGAPEDLIGKSDFDVFSDEHARPAWEDEQQIIRTGEPIIAQEELEILPSGREAWVSTTKMALRDAAGTIIGTCGVSQDITDRRRAESLLRESEERWRTLLANAQEIVTLIDRDGRLVYASPSIGRWLGLDPDGLIGHEVGSVVHPDDAESFQTALAEVVASADRHPLTVQHRARHTDGTWHSLESTLVSLYDNPLIGAVLLTARDVTERVALEQERERLELERRVSQRLEAVGQLAAGIAHEINTPMQFVGDSITFLRDGVEELLTLTNVYRELLHTQDLIDKDERQRRASAAEDDADLDYLCERIPAAFDRTVDGIARVTSIVQAMKRFSHASGSESSPANLNEAIETTLAVCRNEYKYVADVELSLSDLPLVTCNIGELNQVFLNLIINAAQAIGEDEERGTITISTRVEGEDAVIEIADDGPGIPPELQDRIYEPFFTTKEIGQGSGQGLALARMTVVEQHSGSIECTSTVGVGTTFTLRIPLHRASTELPQAA